MPNNKVLNEGLLQRVIAGRSPEDLERIQRAVRDIRTARDQEAVIEEAEDLASHAEHWAENLRAYMARNFAALPAVGAGTMGAILGGPAGAAAGVAAAAVAGAGFASMLPRSVVESERQRLESFAKKMRALAAQARRAKIVKEHLNVSIDIYSDPKSRDRTFADRRAFLIAESAQSTAESIGERMAPLPETAVSAPPVSLMEQRRRQRSLARNGEASRRLEAFLSALGEAVYRAVPMDEHEKSPYREIMVEQTADFARVTASWKPTPTAIRIRDETDEIVAGLAEGSDIRSTIAGAASSETELAAILGELGSEVERRVVAAVAASREQSALTERALTESHGDDAELAACRQRRILERRKPALIEALYMANRHHLTEATGGDVSDDLLLAEAVCQYTMLEMLSALGIVPLDDPQQLISRLVAKPR
jgi:hypothetical protein